MYIHRHPIAMTSPFGSANSLARATSMSLIRASPSMSLIRTGPVIKSSNFYIFMFYLGSCMVLPFAFTAYKTKYSEQQATNSNPMKITAREYWQYFPQRH